MSQAIRNKAASYPGQTVAKISAGVALLALWLQLILSVGHYQHLLSQTLPANLLAGLKGSVICHWQSDATDAKNLPDLAQSPLKNPPQIPTQIPGKAKLKQPCPFCVNAVITAMLMAPMPTVTGLAVAMAPPVVFQPAYFRTSYLLPFALAPPAA